MYILQFKAQEDRRFFFWMQDADDSNDKELTRSSIMPEWRWRRSRGFIASSEEQSRARSMPVKHPYHWTTSRTFLLPLDMPAAPAPLVMWTPTR